MFLCLCEWLPNLPLMYAKISLLLLLFFFLIFHLLLHSYSSDNYPSKLFGIIHRSYSFSAERDFSRRRTRL